MGFRGKPISVLRDFGEDAGFAGAGAGSEGDNADNVVSAGSVVADEGSAGVTHAGGPFAGFAETDNVVGKAVVLAEELTGTPDSAGDLLETVGEGLGPTFDQSPSGEDAVLAATVVFAFSGQASGASVGAVEVDGGGELHEGDVVVELFAFVVSFVDMDLGDSVVFLGAITSLQVPFAGADGVSAGVLGLSEAVSGAEDVLVSNEGSTADVAVSSEAEGDLPGELAVAGINTIDDAAARALLAASLESRCGGDQSEENTNSLHYDLDVLRFERNTE